jgi:tetratricopeptide (TPR) repeat protein
VTDFEEAVNGGDLEAAIELYGGPFADNLVDVGTREFESWVDSERTRLNRLGEIVLRRYVGQCESQGAWGKMCVSALKLAALAPLDEAVHTAFIRALWLNGDRDSALRHFEAIEASLKGEGSEGLSTELRDLVDCIRRQPVVDTMDVRPIDREPPFVGRESAFKRLRDAVTRANASGASVIVVRGEAGIGKSRLLKEFSRSISVEQVRVLESRCYQAEEDLPYTPIVDALTPVVQEFIKAQPDLRTRYARLSDLFPDLGPRESAPILDSSELATWQRQLYEEVASLLGRVTERELVVWTVDDVQWIDRASGALLHYLLRRLSASPFLLVLTTRPSLSADEPPLLDVSGLEAKRAEVIVLEPLPQDQMRELVYAAEPLGPEHPAADLAVRLSAGNPYYALEVLEAAAESSEWAQSASEWDPLNDERLRKLLSVRVSGLSATSVRVLQAIAVLERHARPRIVAAVAGISISKTASVAEELYVRGLVVDDGPRVAFTNDVMREYVYGEMNSLRRTALHLKAGQVLELETTPPPGSLATHFYHGDDWPRSFGYAMEAACSAQRASGHSEAAHFAGIAAEVAPGAAEKGVALVTRGESLFAAGDLTGAAEAYQRVLDSCRPQRSAEVATVCIKLAKTQVERCLWDDAKRVLSICRDAVGKVSSPERRLLLQSERATLLLKHAVRTDDLESATEAADSIDSALSSLRGLTAPAHDTRVAVLTSKAVLLGVRGRSQDALEYMQRAASHLRVSESAQVARYFNYRGVVKAWLADWFGAEADFRKARDIAETIGDRVGLTTQWNNLACVALERGEWAEAEERLSRAEDIHVNLAFSNDASLPIALNRADLLFYQGYMVRAEAAYADAVKMCEEQESTDRRSEAIACLGLIALQRGKTKAALELWELLRRLESPATTGLGTRERFKVAWFSRAMASNGAGCNYLVEAADRERHRDLPSYLKLRWLSVIFDESTTIDRNEVREALHARDMGWFCHVVNRWSRAAQNPSIVRQEG